MRYTQFKAFEKHLDDALPTHGAALYCLILKDPAERLFAFASLKDKLQKRFPDLDCKTYEADGKHEHDFIRDCSMPSLFAQKQLLHLMLGEKILPPTLKMLEKILNDIPSHTLVILSGELLARNSSFYKKMEKQGVILDPGEEKPWEKEKAMAEWLTLTALQTGHSIFPDAISLLVRSVAGSYAVLANEWQKLRAFTDERKTVTLADVEAISILIPGANNWQLGEALLQKDARRALEVVEHFTASGQTTLLALLRQLRYQLSTALHLACYQEVGSVGQIGVKYPYLKGALLEKQLTSAKKFGKENLAASLAVIDSIEFKIKDGWDNPRALITLLIAKIL